MLVTGIVASVRLEEAIVGELQVSLNSTNSRACVLLGVYEEEDGSNTYSNEEQAEEENG